MPRKIEVSGYVVLFVGVALLVFTFINAYLFIQGILGLSFPGDLMGVFGEALAPLIETCIRAIYLGIMGWIGSIVTRRGVQILVAPREAKSEAAPEAELKVKPEVEEVKREVEEIKPKVEKAENKKPSIFSRRKREKGK